MARSLPQQVIHLFLQHGRAVMSWLSGCQTVYDIDPGQLKVDLDSAGGEGNYPAETWA